ncbi:MAG: GtrA family protein [Chloroflexi bacterium]|nr:GtrA family protein [Chloroflexota bacterium]
MISILHNPVERTRFLKFLVVGTLGAAIDFGIANLLTHFADMPLVYAGTISFACAVISNFVWNRHWTYPESRSRHLAHQLGMFFIVNVAGIAIRVPILSFGEPPLQNLFQNLQLKLPFTPEFLARNLTLAIAVGIVMLWNFFVNRYWTYNDI